METETSTSLRQALLTDREHTLTRIYQRAFPLVRRYVQQHGGSAQDAQDIFQDAMVIFYEKAVADTFVLSSSVGTLLVGISRNRWRRELDRRARLPLTELTDQPEPPAEAPAEEPVPVLD
jgi:DNA-directed RNA polymerase specialized sigma24 family protein